MRSIADGVWHLALAPCDGINAYLIGDVLMDTGIKPSAGAARKLRDFVDKLPG